MTHTRLSSAQFKTLCLDWEVTSSCFRVSCFANNDQGRLYMYSSAISHTLFLGLQLVNLTTVLTASRTSLSDPHLSRIAIMSFLYALHGGGVEHEMSWAKTMRGRTQFEISVQHDRIKATYFGDRYLPLVEQYRMDGFRSYQETLQFICNHCSPLLEQLAPQTSVTGLSLEDIVRSPVFTLEVAARGVDRSTRITGARGYMLLRTGVLDVAPEDRGVAACVQDNHPISCRADQDQRTRPSSVGKRTGEGHHIRRAHHVLQAT